MPRGVKRARARSSSPKPTTAKKARVNKAETPKAKSTKAKVGRPITRSQKEQETSQPSLPEAPEEDEAMDLSPDSPGDVEVATSAEPNQADVPSADVMEEDADEEIVRQPELPLPGSKPALIINEYMDDQPQDQYIHAFNIKLDSMRIDINELKIFVEQAKVLLDLKSEPTSSSLQKVSSTNNTEEASETESSWWSRGLNLGFSVFHFLINPALKSWTMPPLKKWEIVSHVVVIGANIWLLRTMRDTNGMVLRSSRRVHKDSSGWQALYEQLKQREIASSGDCGENRGRRAIEL
ncbi:MAG: hypothetical protein Q9219_005077 [cf. Caloplaca sp. 3 TL-2023]